jgi:hypothetical protein
MHVVRLLAPPLAGEDHSKDIDFSAKGIRTRWQAGHVDTKRTLTEMPWSRITKRDGSDVTPYVSGVDTGFLQCTCAR